MYDTRLGERFAPSEATGEVVSLRVAEADKVDEEAVETARTAAKVALDCMAANICGNKVMGGEVTVVSVLVTAKLDEDDKPLTMESVHLPNCCSLNGPLYQRWKLSGNQ